MKLLFENWRGYLTEIGDASANAYHWRERDISEDYAMYEFRTPENFYVVHLAVEMLGGEPWWDIAFRTISNKDGVGLTGESQPLKVMSTIVAIIKDFIDREESKISHRYKFHGLRKGGGSEPAGERSQRTKMYLAFLKRNMPPGTAIETIGQNEIRFTLPKGEEEL